jgi:hypothetical protein
MKRHGTRNALFRMAIFKMIRIFAADSAFSHAPYAINTMTVKDVSLAISCIKAIALSSASL